MPLNKRKKAPAAAAASKESEAPPAWGTCVVCLCVVLSAKGVLADEATSGVELAGCSHVYCPACFLKLSWRTLPAVGVCAAPGCERQLVRAKIMQRGADGSVGAERVSLGQGGAAGKREPWEWLMPGSMQEYLGADASEQAAGVAFAVVAPGEGGGEQGAVLYEGRLSRDGPAPSGADEEALLVMMAAVHKTVVARDVEGFGLARDAGNGVPLEPAGLWDCAQKDQRMTTRVMQTLATGTPTIDLATAADDWREGRKASAGFVMSEVALGASSPGRAGLLQRFLGGALRLMSRVDSDGLFRNLNLSSTAGAFATGMSRVIRGVAGVHNISEVCQLLTHNTESRTPKPINPQTPNPFNLLLTQSFNLPIFQSF